jgi:dihydrofolate reductase
MMKNNFMKAIAAISENRAIGKNGGLPWPSIKEDFKWFKEFTLNKTLIVGRTTFEKLPPLKNRNIIVIYNTLPCNIFEYHTKNIAKCDNLYLKKPNELDILECGDAIVAGGAKTYELLMPYITEFYVTRIFGEYDADVFMPDFEHLFSKQEVIKEFDKHKVIKYSK